MPDETPNPNWTPVDPNAAAYPPPVDPGAPVYIYPPPAGSVPNPTLAGWLGLIPGVGAMYNGQFAKAIAHFVIFAVLASLGDHNGFFVLLMFGWIGYQAFEAYHTARARRDGLPLPNPFGLNDIGERLGFSKSWTGTATPPPYGSQPYAPPAPAPPAPAAPAYAAPAYAPPPPAAQANWAGYIPPAAYAVPPPVVYPPVPPPVEPHVYAETFAGHAYVPPVTPVEPASRFPTAAIILILLGVLILVANLMPDWRISYEWIIPVALYGFAILIFLRRYRVGGNVICMLRAPVVLATLGVLFTLEFAHVATLGQTWPVILLAIGGVLLLERALGQPTAVPGYVPPPADTSFVPHTAAWTEPTPPGPEEPR